MFSFSLVEYQKSHSFLSARQAVLDAERCFLSHCPRNPITEWKHSAVFRPLRQSLLDCWAKKKDQENNIQGDINDRTKIKLTAYYRSNGPDNGKQEQ